MNGALRDVLDVQLVRARAGHAAALSALVRAHQSSVYSLALRMLGTRELAEDLTQDVFMQLQTHLNAIESNRHLKFWLRQVTTRRAIDQLRRRSSIQMTPLEDELALASEEEMTDPLFQRHVRELLRFLNPVARAVVLLRFQEDLDPLDIARTLKMSVNTVKSHLTRSLEIMRTSSGKGAVDSVPDNAE